jgi:hypothetical protein
MRFIRSLILLSSLAAILGCRSTNSNSSMDTVARSGAPGVGGDCSLEEFKSDLELYDQIGTQYIGSIEAKDSPTGGEVGFFNLPPQKRVTGRFNLVGCSLELTGLSPIGLPDQFKVQLVRHEKISYRFWDRRGDEILKEPVKEGSNRIGYLGKSDSETGISLTTGFYFVKDDDHPKHWNPREYGSQIASWMLNREGYLDFEVLSYLRPQAVFKDATTSTLEIGFTDVKSLTRFVERRIKLGKDPFSVDVDFKGHKERVQLYLRSNIYLDSSDQTEIAALPWSFKGGTWRNEPTPIPKRPDGNLFTNRANNEHSKHLVNLLKKLTNNSATVKGVVLRDNLSSGREVDYGYLVTFKTPEAVMAYFNSALQTKYIPSPLYGFVEQTDEYTSLNGIPVIFEIEK